jgi:hypothetical protein
MDGEGAWRGLDGMGWQSFRRPCPGWGSADLGRWCDSGMASLEPEQRGGEEGNDAVR